MNVRHALPLLLLGFGLLVGACAGDVKPLQNTCGALAPTACNANPACFSNGALCEPVDGCDGRDEPSCIAASQCEPVYVSLPCACAPCEDPENCDDCLCADAEVYDSCQPVSPTCGPVCEIACEYGKQTDANGCEICACNPAPVCDAVVCTLACEHGFATGADGCPTCACNPPPPAPVCDAVLCQLACEYGFQVDSDGCEICACNPAPLCEPLSCRLACEFGYVTDDQGCDTCECLPPPPSCGSNAECHNSVCIPSSFHGDVFHCFRADCSDGTELACRRAEPTCPSGQTYSVVNGCYGPCVDALTCELPPCDDGSQVLCDAIAPQCAPGEVNTIVGGCWGPCVDSGSCR